jgi:conjugal transfer pilus assembly protein TraW
MKSAACIFIVIVYTFGSVQAKDFGQHGSISDIQEQDLLEVIQSKLHAYNESGELFKHQQKIAEKVKGYAKRPTPVAGIMKARKNNVRNHDPSIIVSEDIRDHNGNLIHAVGTRVNPLDYMKFDEEWIFIHGDDDKQLKYANDLYNKTSASSDSTLEAIKIVLVSGEAGEREIEGKKYFYYFDQFGLYSKKFNISKAPSILRQSKSNPKVLEIEEVSLERREGDASESQ